MAYFTKFTVYIYGLISNLMKFYIFHVLRNEVLLLSEVLINDADVLFLFYFY